MNPERVRRTLDRLAYVSLFLDVCIAVITGLTVLDAQLTRRLLLPVNYVLSAVVVLSVALFLVLLGLKSKEKRSLRRERTSQSELRKAIQAEVKATMRRSLSALASGIRHLGQFQSDIRGPQEPS